MSTEFSLLQHLGVNVEKCDFSRSVAPTTSSEKETLRVWAPIQHPPTKSGSSQEARLAREKNRKGVHHHYADPTGEVLLSHKNGAEVQCLVYKSRVPSVYGVNKQLAEKKKAEREQVKSTPGFGNGLLIGNDEGRREEARRELLRELHRCNQERARLKKEEELRERVRRMEQERLVLQYNVGRATPREDEVLQEGAVRDAVAEGPSRREAREDDAKKFARGASMAWNWKDEDDRRRAAAAARTRQLAGENLLAAEERRAEHKALKEADRKKAHAEVTKLQMQLAEEHTREMEKHRRDAEELRGALEAARESQCRGNAVDACRQAGPSGSLFDEVERREREAAVQARQRLADDLAFNLRLAAQKRESIQAERERERRLAADRARAEVESLRCDMAHMREKRHQEMLQLQQAAEVAAKHRQEHADPAQRWEQSMEPLLFWSPARASQSEEFKKAKARRFYEDLQRQAEKKVQDRAQEREAERAMERALVDYDIRSAQEAAAHECKEARKKAEDLRHALESQIALKRAGMERKEDTGAHLIVSHVPATEAMLRYICPVTGELLPASAYDFGVQSGRSRTRK